MEVAHSSTGKTARMKEKRKQKQFEKAKADAIIRKQRRKQRWKLHLIVTGLILTLFFFNFQWYIALIPLPIHLFFCFWTLAIEFYTAKKKAIEWNKYLKKYGMKMPDGSYHLPEHVKMTHKKMVENGKQIAV